MSGGIERPRGGGLLVAGTTSDAGKSVVTAGICRWLARQGVKVAPFKAQNMSLNSFVTREGAEIGRAQAMQAQACRIEPTALMNPVLLKPGGERSSQVVLLGRPVGEMSARGYHGGRQRELLSVVLDALAELRATHDAVICEGAGSPAEINLRRTDIVNMGIARNAKLPVLVVGDIDRGGVFASFFGTVALLSRKDQELVAGFLVNKFRGDVSLLEPGLDMLHGLTGRSTYGVLPFRHGLGIDEEDGMGVPLLERRSERGEELAARDRTGVGHRAAGGRGRAAGGGVRPAADVQLHGRRRARGRTRCAGALRGPAGGTGRRRPRHRARHARHRPGPGVAAGAGARRRPAAQGRRGAAGPRDLRRLPDPRRADRGRGRVARRARGRPRAAARARPLRPGEDPRPARRPRPRREGRGVRDPPRGRRGHRRRPLLLRRCRTGPGRLPGRRRPGHALARLAGVRRLPARLPARGRGRRGPPLRARPGHLLRRAARGAARPARRPDRTARGHGRAVAAHRVRRATRTALHPPGAPA